jgi:threonyl-tRNA synthetase
VPVILAVGKKEVEQRQVSMRRLGSEAQEFLPLDDCVNKMVEEAAVPV